MTDCVAMERQQQQNEHKIHATLTIRKQQSSPRASIVNLSSVPRLQRLAEERLTSDVFRVERHANL